MVCEIMWRAARSSSQRSTPTVGIAVLANYIGPHKILWATDYPHSDGFFPGAPKMLSERLGSLSPEAKHQVLGGGALGFYGLS